jgi:drug/metabolite transporter (DMT)-like permease
VSKPLTIERGLLLATPPTFVVLWATGFVVARLVAPHTEPLIFLTLRFGLSAGILALAAVLVRAPWPRGAANWRDALVAGILLHGLYLSAVFWSVRHGLPAGISALLAGLQPLLTATLAGPVLGERVGLRRWSGILLGFAGALLVLGGNLGTAAAYPPIAVAICLGGTISLSAGLLWQKRTGRTGDLRTGTAVQYLGALLVTVPLTLLTETGRVDFAPAFWIGLAWSIFGLSIGAVGLLLLMIRRGAVAAVAALMFLVPPVAALIGFALFGETLTIVQIAGMGLATIGVAIANTA